jgi:hypothetical protein
VDVETLCGSSKWTKASIGGLRSDVPLLKASTLDFPSSSLIVSDFLEIFTEFRTPQLSDWVDCGWTVDLERRISRDGPRTAPNGLAPMAFIIYSVLHQV